MAVAIPSLPMTGSSLKTSLDALRAAVPFKASSVTEMQGLSDLVAGDRCLLPQGAFDIVDGLSLPTGETVIDLTGGLQAVLSVGAPVADVAALLADTRTPAFFETGACLRTRAEGFSYDVADPAASDAHVQTAGGVKLYARAGESGFNVRAFGAVGDGAADDSAAVAMAFTAAVAARQTPAVGSNAVNLHRIHFPGGEYRITTPRSLMDATGLPRSMGLSFEGDASGTSIHFDYNGDDYLAYNDNELLFVRFRHLRFTCSSDLSKFLFVDANGGAQDILFEDCNWNGVWQKLYRLEGSNNNSEWKWSNCAVTASIRDVMLDIPSANSSDQFLNYWFTNTKLWLYDGQCIRAHKGGHFHFVNCDWSGLEPGMTLNTSVNGGALFELLGATHSRGVCSLTVTGGRFEHKNSNSKLLYCEWPHGTVSFRDVDCAPVSPVGYETVTHVELNTGNAAGPQVLFDSCDLIGQHKYVNGTNGWNFEHNARYNLCTIRHDNPDEFLVFDRTSNRGGSWLVALDRCKSATPNLINGEIVVWDAVFGARYAMNSHFGKRSFVFRSADGRGTPLTTGTFAATLPAGALVTRVSFRNSGLLTSSITADFQVEDGAGTVIASTSGVPPLNVAWSVDAPTCYMVPAGEERLVLRNTQGTANQNGTTLFVEVEFIA
ncbi:glycosyl hydrolase family 28-related protein [Pacificoceanicola onchidii]|uniref:glycosyl hydrolase family 28-related protein n=1 Tax=Pacificoceanicola onchidii TaxID=2562685 RepID=UPI0010A5C1C2|nr:glycosyl hydrolase family 28-related protein [Pacificoceanicola onchidii]